MSRSAHIIAVGARTPVGLRASTSAAAVRAGINRVQVHDDLLDPAGEPLRAAFDGRLDPRIMGVPRLGELLTTAVHEVLEPLPPVDPQHPIPLLLALPEPRPGFGPPHESELLARLAPLGGSRHPLRVRAVGRGHAGGLLALHQARELVEGGALDLVLVGGVDGYLEADTIDWLGHERRLATRHTRSSLFPGEGAGVLAVASESHLRSLGCRSLARVSGTGIATEPTIGASDPYAVNLGRGLIDAIGIATAALAGSVRIDRVLCDLNGERLRSEEWGLAALTVHHRLAQAGDYQAPAEQWGDVGAASGPLLAIVATQGWAQRSHLGAHVLIFAGSNGGLRGASVLERPSIEHRPPS